MNSKTKDLPPILRYLEFHLTDHCNLNCKGCGHFCPIAEESYLTVDACSRDMERLANLFDNISKIRILGGEPLLHPMVADFVEIARRYFPYSSISVVTNGILLPRMTHKFYETLQKNRVALDVTVYPLTQKNMDFNLSLASKYGIQINLRKSNEFYRILNTTGHSDKSTMFNQCFTKTCTFLHLGKLSPCPLSLLVHNANRKFGWHIPDDGYIDIHTDIAATDILDFLSRPISACSYCSQATPFPWEVSKRQPTEWLA